MDHRMFFCHQNNPNKINAINSLLLAGLREVTSKNVIKKHN